MESQPHQSDKSKDNKEKEESNLEVASPNRGDGNL